MRKKLVFISILFVIAGLSKAGQVMKTEFNHAANDSPRSGGSKRVTPAVWGAILVALVTVVIGYMLHA